MRPFDPRVLRLVPAARGPLLGLLLLGVLGGLAAIAQAVAIAGIVLAVVEPGRDLGSALLVAAVAFAVRAGAAGATEVVAAHAGAVVSCGLRAALADDLLRRPAERAPAPDRASTLLTQGASSVEPYVARYLPTLVAAAFLPPAVIIAMGLLDPVTALIPVLTVPLLPVFAALIGSSTADATARRWRTLAALSGHFLDVMRGLPVLVSYGRARRQAAMVRDVSERHRRATVQTLRLAFVSSGALELLATISVAIVAVWVGIHLAEGDMALSVALPLILLAPEAYWPIRRVGAEFHSAADGAQALADIADELERGAQASGSATHGQDGVGQDGVARDGVGRDGVGRAGVGRAVVRLSGLGYRYGDGLPWVLQDVDATLGGSDDTSSAGDSGPVNDSRSTNDSGSTHGSGPTHGVRAGAGLVVVTGRSGAGKTTLLELIAGLREPTVGTIDAPASRQLVTQRPFLVAGTLRDNLLLRCAALAPPPADDTLAAALHRVGLRLPLDLPVGDDGFGLSAGQRARVALAGAILADPDLVLLDEPTAHLDPAAEATVHDVITELARTRLVIAVSHRQGLADLADAHLAIGAALAQESR